MRSAQCHENLTPGPGFRLLNALNGGVCGIVWIFWTVETPMATSIFRNRVIASCLAFGTLVFLASPSHVLADCGISEQTAVGPNEQEASPIATQKIKADILRGNGVEDLRNITYSMSGCLYLDDGTNRVQCTVRGDFCVTPKVGPQLGLGPIPARATPPATSGQRPALIPIPSTPQQGCVTFRAR